MSDEKQDKEWSETNIRSGFAPSEAWGTVHEIKPRMGWPEACSNIGISLCLTVILVVLFMCLWGPW